MIINLSFTKLRSLLIIPSIFRNKVRMPAAKDLDRSQYVLPLDQPIVTLEASTAFSGLTGKEKQYAYHISSACWSGGLITLFQTSPESGPLFILLHKLFCAQDPKTFRIAALEHGFTKEEITAFFVFASGLFSNAGNYKGFGDTKFIPGIEEKRLKELLKTSPIWDSIETIWDSIHTNIYDLSPGKTCLGFPPHGSNTYFSKNCVEADSVRVQKWLKAKGIECWNTRCFKTENKGHIVYEIRLAGENTGDVMNEKVDNISYNLTQGDYSPIMKQVASNLESAIPFAANTNQAEMLQQYAKSFVTGSLNAHKDGSRLWIKDKAPAVENYIGFIETYRDPAGVRGEFEGFVAIVNRAMSAKFTVLVNSAEKLLHLLPWAKSFEKDKFLRPDFTSLDVLTFAGSGVPAGINIPNYDDVRQHEGFKNVSLGNVIPTSYKQIGTSPFITESDAELLKNLRVASFEVQVGLHELLGHGSGKLFYKNEDGKFNFPEALINPLNGKLVTSYYEPGDTYDSVFGSMSSAYEECRAEAVGLYLSLDPSILSIFGHTGTQCYDIMYVNWLSLVYSAIFALEMWDPQRGWLQSHSQARFCLTKVLIEAGVVTVKQVGDNNLLLTLDRDSFLGAGRNAIGHFLLKLQVYKSTADLTSAKEMFDHYTLVDEPWRSWRAIVLANKKPRKMMTQPNLTKVGNEITLKVYEESVEGLIQSWVERFDKPEPLYDAIVQITKNDAKHFI